MYGAIRQIGLFFASIKGWAILVSTLPGIATLVVGQSEGLPSAAIITYTSVSLVCGLASVALGFWIFERATIYFTTRKEQDRIITALGNLGENVEKLDLPTAAAIWAGTLDSADIVRHTYFRGLKDAVDNKKIRAFNLNARGHAYIKTHVDLEDLKDFWRTKGVIR